ncbi:MAG TPA: glycosyltransferase family 2 protein [Candidatus Woesebacteria bacterium]|nr:glycosyltransferase family 2 protein [Candidatus Woesebacteria bacterium]
MKVSIIILSYNTGDLLKNCLTSLYSHLKTPSFEVIVVDNASSDSSVGMIKTYFKHVTIIENKENVGFAKGCNIGAKHASGEYLLFLNSDTEIHDPNALTNLLSLMKEEKVAVAGGLMLNEDKSFQRSFGEFYTLPHVAKMLFLGEKSEISGQTFNAVQKTDWVSGGFMLVRKTIFEKVQGFDEKYFMYVEDVDLCYRIHKAGYIVVVDPKIQILHVGHGSSNRSFAVINIYKGLSRFYKQHRSSVEYVSLRLLLSLKAYVVMFFATMKGDKALSERYRKALSSL